jgi:hypothetical protein
MAWRSWLNCRQISGVLGIPIDITGQKRAEARLIKANEAAETADNAKIEFFNKHSIRCCIEDCG